MTSQPPRLNLLDAMILVAAIAAGLASTRGFAEVIAVEHGLEVRRWKPPGHASYNQMASAAYIDWTTGDSYKPRWRGHGVFWATHLVVRHY